MAIGIARCDEDKMMQEYQDQRCDMYVITIMGKRHNRQRCDWLHGDVEANKLLLWRALDKIHNAKKYC
jgi:type II secretory pathway predicted ATPase ExeA